VAKPPASPVYPIQYGSIKNNVSNFPSIWTIQNVSIAQKISLEPSSILRNNFA
jgi:hypothetical protein